MVRSVLQDELWNTTLDLMEKKMGKSLVQDRKGTLQVLLQHLEILIEEVSSILEDHFVPLGEEAVQETGMDPIIIPRRLSSLFADRSFVLYSDFDKNHAPEVKEELEDNFSYDEDVVDPPIEDYDEDGGEMEEEDEGAYTCAKCFLIFESYDDLVDHLQHHCDGEEGETKSPKKRPPRAKHPIEDRTCTTCSRTFSTQHYLKRVHSKKCTKSPQDDPFKNYLLNCSNCTRVYKSVLHYYLHIRTCGVPETKLEKVDSRSLNKISCRKCGYIASSEEEFQTKDHKCEPKKLFKCLNCDFQTFSWSSLRNHELAIHQKDKAMHVCEICGATFSYKCGLRRHLKTHMEKIPCAKCGKIFSNQFTLNRHLENFHAPTQKHPCEICGKTFSMLRYLKRHISSQHPESGELEKHECLHCHSFFREKAYLKKHIRKKHSK